MSGDKELRACIHQRSSHWSRQNQNGSRWIRRRKTCRNWLHLYNACSTTTIITSQYWYTVTSYCICIKWQLSSW